MYVYICMYICIFIIHIMCICIYVHIMCIYINIVQSIHKRMQHRKGVPFSGSTLHLIHSSLYTLLNQEKNKRYLSLPSVQTDGSTSSIFSTVFDFFFSTVSVSIFFFYRLSPKTLCKHHLCRHHQILPRNATFRISQKGVSRFLASLIRKRNGSQIGTLVKCLQKKKRNGSNIGTFVIVFYLKAYVKKF